LYFKIKPIDKGRTTSSSLSKGVSMDKNGGESVSALMNEGYAEEAEVASFTDDDVSSHSSLANGGLPPQNDEVLSLILWIHFSNQVFNFEPIYQLTSLACINFLLL
jgi:hypothetical protein